MKRLHLLVLSSLGIVWALACPVEAWAAVVSPTQYDIFTSEQTKSFSVSPVAVYTHLSPGVINADELNPQPLPPGSFSSFDISNPVDPSVTVNLPASSDGAFVYFGPMSPTPGPDRTRPIPGLWGTSALL